MKLLRAEFQNFRMLRDLEFEFSNDPETNLNGYPGCKRVW